MPGAGNRSSLLSSVQPTITISSMSELTGVVDSVNMSGKTTLKDEYIVVNPDTLAVSANTAQGSTCSSGNELKLSLHGEEHSMSPGPSTPPVSLSVPFDSLSPSCNTSFTVVDNREIIKAIPVPGLSSAAEAAQDLESENGIDVKSNEEARALFESEYMSHFDAVMIQLIKSHGLSLSWLKVIKPLIMEATQTVKTNVYSTDIMDIKAYVKVKKIPGGRRSDSTLINGVVCTKNITHKNMKINIRKPTILLLKCAFEFQRKENQLSSFDTLHMQEEKYLKNVVARVKTFQPRVILVQKSVARLALEMFYHLDIVVAVNVKPSVMERVARCTQGDLLHSLDQLFFNVQLGSCGEFYLRNFVLPDGVKKTLMYFDHCDPSLGCVITLMGGLRRELKKVKKTTLFGVFLAYNSQLESSFLIDEFAWPVSLSPQLLPDLEGYSSSPTTPEWPLHPSISYPTEGISPTELASKLEALVPDLKVDRELSGCSSRSTPTMLRSSFASRSSHASPLITSNTRSYSLCGPRGDGPEAQLEEGSTVKHLPMASRFLDDATCRSHSDPTLLLNRNTCASADPTTLGEKEFEKVLASQILSVTPGVKFPIPYLQSPQGFRAELRQYLPSVIYWSYQFLAITQPQTLSPKLSRKKSFTNSSPPQPSPLEMGITKSSLEGNADQSVKNSEPEVVVDSPQHGTKSYRSISEHPFTTSIFLLRANTNEMRAAIADYRANSGLTNPSQEFFFPTASRASDYHMHLRNIFNKYQQFVLAQQSDGANSGGAGDERGDSRGSSVVQGVREMSSSLEGSDEGEKPLRRRNKRHNTPSFSSSEKLTNGSVPVVGTNGARQHLVNSDTPDKLGGKEMQGTHTPDDTARHRGTCICMYMYGTVHTCTCMDIVYTCIYSTRFA